MARNSGGRAIGASSLTLASAIRWADFFAAPASRSIAYGPSIRNAIISRDNSGSAAARSTIESSTTTPIRVAPPWVKVASFIRIPLGPILELLIDAHQPPHRCGIESPGGVILLELGLGHAGVKVARQFVGVEVHANRILLHRLALKESLQLL